jgi:hypothetical protein
MWGWKDIRRELIWGGRVCAVWVGVCMGWMGVVWKCFGVRLQVCAVWVGVCDRLKSA